MFVSVRSAAVVGIDAYAVNVEIDVAPGLPQWTIVGLPAGAVKESRERVSAALVNSGFQLPARRITINLAPADIRKEGTAFDLPIALGVLAATRQLRAACLEGVVALGELGLDGAVRPVRGILPVARSLATQSKRDGARLLLVPPGNVAEASLVADAPLAAPPSLAAVLAMLRDGKRDAPAVAPPPSAAVPDVDLSEVVGQDIVRRALEIAAAGGHALLMIGPPGAGKTMLARRLPTILPTLDPDEALEVIAVHSVAGLLPPGRSPVATRPFRAPHHTLSAAALIGGGSPPRPGEVSLAHHGVLFLDELQEMPRHVLDVLRQPLEEGRVVIARAAASLVFPARFTLVGAMNPCPCGHAGVPAGTCTCSAADIARHRGRVSGPLADRIDMTVFVPAVPLRALGHRTGGETSAVVRERVAMARARQAVRYRTFATVRCNAHVHGRWLDLHAPIDRAARELLATASERLRLSARGYHRVLKVARTIADLDGDPAVMQRHVAEALHFRTGNAVS